MWAGREGERGVGISEQVRGGSPPLQGGAGCWQPQEGIPGQSGEPQKVDGLEQEDSVPCGKKMDGN